MKSLLPSLVTASLISFVVACATKPEPQPEQAPAPAAEPAGNGLPVPETSDRPKLSASECQAAGGHVVGDIGNGAVHRPDYVCPETAVAPLGTIVPDEGGPIAMEGAVCCPGKSG